MNTSADIVIIDPDPHLLSKMSEKTKQVGFSTCCFSDPDTSVQHIESSFPRLALLGPSLDRDSYLKCVHKLKIMNSALPILTVSNINNHLGISKSNTLEEFNIGSSEPHCEDFTQAIISVSNREKEKKTKSNFPQIIGKSKIVCELRQKIKTLADRDITVLVTGESGVGKELIALYLHYFSSRQRWPLINVNCAALPEGLFESEIFGFRKGAFTDAYRDKPGRLEMAHKGTLFLDEVGSLTPRLQAKILQVLEDREFSKLGDTKDKIIDARIVLATNQDLKEKIRQGSFRKDLYYRLNVMNIRVPPLRERKEDIDLLVDYFIHKYAYELKREVITLPADVMQYFYEYHWPGNIRELENIVRRIAILGNADFIFEELRTEIDIPKYKLTTSSHDDINNHPSHNKKINDLFKKNSFSLKKITKAYVSEIERKEILKALDATKWNRKKSAELLEVSYKKLRNRIIEFKIEK
jgi:two-component system response regulator AtoC